MFYGKRVVVGEATASESRRYALEFDGLRIECGARRVLLDGVALALTKTEFDLLIILAESAHSVVTGNAIADRLWGTKWLGDGHAVEVQVSRLRKKLQDTHANPRFITTVRGAGYRFDGQPRPLVTITYGVDLHILAIDPSDRPFLGWDPQDLIGKFILLAAGVSASITKEEVLEILRLRMKVGPRNYETTVDVWCADGSVIAKRVRYEIFSDEHGEFAGARTTIL